MRQNVFLIYSDQTKYVANKMLANINIDKSIYVEDNRITADLLLKLAKLSLTPYFYIIRSDMELCFDSFVFDYVPDEYDNHYMHIWRDNASVMLLNRSLVLKEPNKYTDDLMLIGEVELKIHTDRIFTPPVFDMILLIYDEPNTLYREKLRNRFPRLKSIIGVEGIYNAHLEAAKSSNTDMFYVIDADADVLDTFNFDINPPSWDRESVHIWHSLNPINFLEYGYGGIKLFPKDLLLSYKGSPLDFTTSVSKSLKVIPEVANVTRFNTDPFSAWRSGFRECVKLSSKSILGQSDLETEERLKIWCTVGIDAEFGDFVIDGANKGAYYGRMHANQPDKLGLINDYEWLRTQFQS